MGSTAQTTPVVNRDYELLTSKPSINGVTLIGDRTSEELHEHYAYEQTVAAATWSITHNMGKYPSVTIVDSAGSAVVGDVLYIDENTLTVSFTGACLGYAYLN